MISVMYRDRGLLDSSVECDRSILITLRRKIPTPWHHDIVSCLDRKVASDLHAYETNSSAPSSIHYDSSAWWAHASKVLKHVTTHVDYPKHLASLVRAHLNPTAIAEWTRSRYPELSRTFRAAHMKAKHHMMRNESVRVPRHLLHPSVRHIAHNSTRHRDEPRSTLLTYAHRRWTHRDNADPWLHTMYPIQPLGADVHVRNPTLGRRRILSVASEAKSLTTCIQCKQIDDLWAAIVDTIDMTIKSYRGTTLKNGGVVEPIGVRLERVASDIAVDAAAFADTSGGQPIGFPLLKRSAESRGDEYGWRYLAKTDNVIFSSVQRAVRARGLNTTIETIDVDALLGSCSTNEDNSGGILFKRLDREGVAQGALWAAVAFIGTLAIGGPIGVVFEWVVCPLAAGGAGPVLMFPVAILNSIHVLTAAFLAHAVYVTMAYGQPLWCNFPLPVFPIYLMDDIVNVLRESTPSCLCQWFPSLVDELCDATCWWPTAELPMYKPCASVIDNYGLIWAVTQPFEWVASALISPLDIGAIDAELTPLDRTELSCYYYTLATQTVLVFMCSLALLVGLFAFALQLPMVAQPFYGAHLSLWNTISIAMGRFTLPSIAVAIEDSIETNNKEHHD